MIVIKAIVDNGDFFQPLLHLMRKNIDIAYIYNNLIDQVKTQLSRTPRQLPTMRLNPEIKDIFDFKYEDFVLENYDPWPAIKGEVSV